MNTFVDATVNQQNEARTFNDAATNRSSLNACVDLFAIIGNRNQTFVKEFELAFHESLDAAVRILLWSRDIRGGAGERKTFRNLLLYMEQHHPDVLLKVLPKVPFVGRWDDLLIFATPRVQSAAFDLIARALADRDALCAKWMPRESVGKKGRERSRTHRNLARALAKHLGIDRKEYRKLLASLSQTVETQMCAKTWDGINYSHVPSLASARYQKAFLKHDTERYNAWKAELAKPKEERDPSVKVNVGAVYPYDIVKSVHHGDHKVAMAQWDALPNFMGDKRIIPMVDVSGSMMGWSFYDQRGVDNQVRNNVTPFEIAVSLGLYCSDKLRGSYNGMFLTFSATPHLQKLTGNLVQKINQMASSGWDMNTNLEAAMQRILDLAITNACPQEDMPEVLLVLSDMEFDQCARRPRDTLYTATAKAFEAAGYKLPQIVFWNLNSRSGNYPVKFDTHGTALVSGFSPAIMKSVLAVEVESFSPTAVMLQTIMNDRYKVEGLETVA